MLYIFLWLIATIFIVIANVNWILKIVTSISKLHIRSWHAELRLVPLYCIDILENYEVDYFKIIWHKLNLSYLLTKNMNVDLSLDFLKSFRNCISWQIKKPLWKKLNPIPGCVCKFAHPYLNVTKRKIWGTAGASNFLLLMSLY